MKIQNQVTINISANQNEQADSKFKSGRSIFAGNLKEQFDPIAQKRAAAQKKAMKVVGDAFASEQKISDDLENRRTHIRELTNQMGDAKTEIQKVDNQREELRQTMGVEVDSQEQKDLELMLKHNAKMRGEQISLTEEESSRVMDFLTGKEKYTDYQKQALEIDGYASPYRTIVKEAQAGILEENTIIRGIRQERLKSNPIGEAQDKADAIMEAAGDEILGMLVEEGKEHMDQRQEENQEKAEEKAQKEQDEQEKLDAIKAQKEQLEQQIEGNDDANQETDYTDLLSPDLFTANMVKNSQVKTDVQQEIDNIVNKMKLVAEDIKGTTVDSKR